MTNHDHHHCHDALKRLRHEITDKSWLTLSLPYHHHDDASLSCHASQPSSSSSSSSTPSPPRPRPSPFVYTPLTPPTRRPIQTIFFPQILFPTLQLSQPDPDLIIPKLPHHTSSLSQDSHQEKQEQEVHVSLPNTIASTSTSNGAVLKRRQSNQQPSCPGKRRKLKTDTIPPPFPWATSNRATLHTLDHLLSELKLKTISGTLQCKYCMFQQEVQLDLVENFKKVTEFIEQNIHEMLDRAPDIWLHPVLPNCESCGKEKAMQPLITKKRNINWLFMLLSQTIGCRTIDDLKYFCKHTGTHRTGAKDRLLYSTYFGLCKQLQPNIAFYS